MVTTQVSGAKVLPALDGLLKSLLTHLTRNRFCTSPSSTGTFWVLTNHALRFILNASKDLSIAVDIQTASILT